MTTEHEVRAYLKDKGHIDLLRVETSGDGKYILVRPRRYLADKWQPIMDDLNACYGNAVEWPKGLGKQGHWRILVNGGAVKGSAADYARTIDNIISQLMKLKNDLAGDVK